MSVKLEKENRTRLKETQQEVRRSVVEDRKKELGRTLRDLDDMLQKLHAENQMRTKEYQILYTNESDMKVELEELQKEVERLLKIDPTNCASDKMAGISSKIEATRRNILRIEISGGRSMAANSIVPSGSTPTSSFSLSSMTPQQLLKAGLAFTAPLIFGVFFGALLVAGALLMVFG